MRNFFLLTSLSFMVYLLCEATISRSGETRRDVRTQGLRISDTPLLYSCPFAMSIRLSVIVQMFSLERRGRQPGQFMSSLPPRSSCDRGALSRVIRKPRPRMALDWKTSVLSPPRAVPFQCPLPFRPRSAPRSRAKRRLERMDLDR